MKKSSAREKFEELKKAQEELKRMQGLQTADSSVETQKKKPDIGKKIAGTVEKVSEATERAAKRVGKLKQNIQNAFEEKKKKSEIPEAAATSEAVQGIVTAGKVQEVNIEANEKVSAEGKAQRKEAEKAEEKKEEKSEVVSDADGKSGAKEETALEKKAEPKEESKGEAEPKQKPEEKKEPNAETKKESQENAETGTELKAESQKSAEPKAESKEGAEPKEKSKEAAEAKAEPLGEAEPKEESKGEAEPKEKPEEKKEPNAETKKESQENAEEGTELKAESQERAESQEESEGEAEPKEESKEEAEPKTESKEESQPEPAPNQAAACKVETPEAVENVSAIEDGLSEETSRSWNRWHRISAKCKNTVLQHKKAVLLSSVALLAVLLIVYGGFAFYYSDKFFKGTYINQIACEGLTVEQVEERIREEVENYKISVTFRGDITEDITGGDIDYKYISSGEVQKIKDEQNSLLWFSGFFKEKDYTTEKATAFDESKLQKTMESMEPMKESSQIAPTDASVDYVDGKFVILEEEQGAQLDTDAAVKAVEQAIGDNRRQIDLEESDVYAKPGVTKDDAGLQKECEQLNELARVNVTYQLPNGEKILNGEDLKEWLDVDEDGNYVKDEDKFAENIKEFVAGLAEKVDTRGKARPFHTTSGLDVTVKGGSYGWRIDQKEEIAGLTANIENHETVEREPEYNSREKYTENNGIGTTYIEVNLTEQHLYYYQEGEIVLDSDFVSGMMIKSRYTPEGVFFLDWKTTDTYLTGQINPETGLPSYRSHVNYWMPFNGGIGFHDALWRDRFGGTIYKNSGSHGCINMPLEKAKKLYSLIDKETPIICVYTEEYELYY